MTNTNEIWYDLVEFNGFYVINHSGEVKSKSTTSNRCGRKPSGRVLKTSITNVGYRTVGLSINGKQKRRSIHRLLAITFIPNPENKRCVNHIDCDRLNNDLSNLEWATYSENNSYAFKVGGQRKYIGEKHSQNILTEKDVLEIRKNYQKHKVTMPMLAKKYNVSRGAIQGVLLRKSWKHI